MVGKYALGSFLRQTSGELLRRYSDERHLWKDVDLDATFGSRIGPLMDAWELLPSTVRSAAESDFRLVHSLADQLGVQAILSEGAAQGEDLLPEFDKLRGLHDKVLWVLLERPGYVEVAER